MRVVIAEDEALLRQGMVALVQGAGMDVAATASDAPTLRDAVRAHQPDVLLTDIRIPPGNTDDGLQAAIELRREQPTLGVMVLSQFLLRRYAIELIADNPVGVGYQLKQRVSNVDAFLADLRTVAAGGTALDPDVIQLMLTRADTIHDRLEHLTPRQREVLALVAQGRSNTAIAHLWVPETRLRALTCTFTRQRGMS